MQLQFKRLTKEHFFDRGLTLKVIILLHSKMTFPFKL